MATIDSVKLPDNSTYDLTDNYSGYQKQTLTTPLTINGVQETTVEGALGGLNDYVDDTVKAAFDVYGAKNLLVYPYYDTTKELNGITFTDNGDGTITVSGTASTAVDFAISLRTQAAGIEIPNGSYKMNGCPSGGGASTYRLRAIRTHNSAVDYLGDDTGSGVAITLNGDDFSNDNVHLGVLISIASGATITTPIVFRPMFYDARIWSAVYAPPSKTNVQLTNDKAERKDLTTIFATGTTNTTGAQIAEGKFFYLNGVYCKAKTNIAVNATFTLNTNFEVASVGKEIERISATKRGTNTTITGYTDASNPYICPEDGYITINSAALTTGIIRLMILGSDNQTVASEYMNINGAYSVRSIYVRKGMKAYLADITTGAGAEYRSLV